MHTNLIYLFAGLMLVSACKKDDGKEGMQTTPLGNRYTYVDTNDDGQLAEAGDFIYFNVILRGEDETNIIVDTREEGGDPPVLQAAPDSISAENIGGPVQDIVRKLRVGERVLIRTNISEFPAEQRPPGLQNDTVALYDIEVIEVVSQDEFTQRQEKLREEAEAKAETVRGRAEERLAFGQEVFEDYKAGRLDEKLKTTASGLKYLIHEAGNGKEAEAGKQVVVQYIGRLASNGEVFDQSFEGGMGIPFPLGAGRVIAGWDEGIELLREGDEATLFIPSELGYGEQGSGGTIPPDSELIFYVELEEVN